MDIINSNVYNFQDPATPVAEGIIDLHNYIIFYLIWVLVFVISILFDIFVQSYEIYKERFFVKYKSFGFYGPAPLLARKIYSFKWRKSMLKLNRVNHATNLEIAWTVLPSFILVLIAIPSLSLLYSMDEMLYPELTFKAIGYQWYWSYEIRGSVSEDFIQVLKARNFSLSSTFSDLGNINFDSYMESVDWAVFGHRLLAVDEVLALPIRQHIRVLVTGADVLHSWAVPSFGIKIDAVPGRLNQGAIYVKRSGVFYGQCSELCGVNHGFMPIVVHAMDGAEVEQWAFEKSVGVFRSII